MPKRTATRRPTSNRAGAGGEVGEAFAKRLSVKAAFLRALGAPSTTLRVVPLPRFTGEDAFVIARSICDEAIQSLFHAALDCFAGACHRAGHFGPGPLARHDE
jgi:hypothetical protein